MLFRAPNDRSATVSYIVVLGCSPEVDRAAFARWLHDTCGSTPADTAKVIERLRVGKRHTLFLGDKEAAQFMRKATSWGFTEITLHDDDDMSEYPPPPGFWAGLWWRLRCWV